MWGAGNASNSFDDNNIPDITNGNNGEIFVGLKVNFNSNGSLTTNYLVPGTNNNPGTWTGTFDTQPFVQGQSYIVEYFMYNEPSGGGTTTYTYNGASVSITKYYWHVYVNGVRAFTGGVAGQYPSGSMKPNGLLTSFMFYGENSSSNACMFFDNCFYNSSFTGNDFTEYYSKSTGNLNSTASWGSSPDGSGTPPTNFTTAGHTFYIRNNASPTLGASWTVSGTGSKAILGDGINTCTFTIPSAYTLTGTIDVSNAGILNLVNTTYPTFGTLATGSTVRYSAAGNQTVFTTTYYNLSIQGTGTKTINGSISATNRTYIGDGSNAVTFTIPSSYTLTSTVDVANAGILDIANTTLPTLGTLSSGSTVRYSATTNQSVSGAAYSYLQIYGSGTKTLTGTASAGNSITVGDGTNTVTLSVPAAYGLTGTTNVLGGNTLILTSTTIPTMGSLGTNSVVRYNATGAQNVSGGSYSILQIYGTGVKTLLGTTSAGVSTTVGDGTNAVQLTVPGSYALTGTVNVGASSTLRLENTTTPTLGTLGTGSYVIYAALGNQNVYGAAYQYLQILGTGNKTITSNNASAAYATPVGDGTNAVTFIIPASLTFTGTVNVLSNATLDIENITLPTLGTLASGSTVRYNYAGNQNVTGTTYYNMDVDNGYVKTMQNDVTVTNLNFANAGTLSLNSHNLYLVGKYISFYSTNAVFSSLTANYSDAYVAGLGCGRIWSTTGTFTNNVDATFTFPYATTPSSMYVWYKGISNVWQRGSLVTPTYSSGTATVTVPGITALIGDGSKAAKDWTFAEAEQTLPVELSSFTVSISNVNNVTLQWVTQSETNVSGYRIYRGTTDQLDNAEMLNVFVPATNTSQMQVYVVTDDEVYEDGTYYYWLENLDMDGSSTLHGPISISVTVQFTGSPDIPLIAGLNKAYPNPFTPDVNLAVSMDKAGWSEVNIYNLRGQKVRSLYAGSMDKGSKVLHWDSRDDQGRTCTSGIYFAVMSIKGGATTTLKLMLMK